MIEKDTLKMLRKELRDLDDAMTNSERNLLNNGLGIVDFTMYRINRVAKPIEILKGAIRRAMLIMKVMSQNQESPDIVTLL
jgi:hypothetical protein